MEEHDELDTTNFLHTYLTFNKDGTNARSDFFTEKLFKSRHEGAGNKVSLYKKKSKELL